MLNTRISSAHTYTSSSSTAIDYEHLRKSAVCFSSPCKLYSEIVFGIFSAFFSNKSMSLMPYTHSFEIGSFVLFLPHYYTCQPISLGSLSLSLYPSIYLSHTLYDYTRIVRHFVYIALVCVSLFIGINDSINILAQNVNRRTL